MKYLNLLLFLFITYTLSGQIYNFKNFDPITVGSDQINSNFIYDFDQNSVGKLFIATSNGLLIHDGISFDLLNEEDGLRKSFISSVFVDSKDIVWISYYKGGIGKIENNIVSYFTADFFVTNIEELHSGEIIFNTENGSYTIKNEVLIKNTKFENTIAISILDKGVLQLKKNKNLFYIHEKNNQKFLIHKKISLISTDKSQNRFLVINDFELILYEISQADSKPKEIKRLKRRDFQLNTEITDIVLKNNQLTLSTIDNGIINIQFSADFSTYSSNVISTNSGLISNSINCLFIDKEENLWIGSYGKGFTFLPFHRVVTYKQTDSNFSDAINCIEYYKNVIYIGTESGIYTIHNNHEQAIQKYLEDKTVLTLKKEKDILWIGTLNNGLFYLKEKKIHPFIFPSSVSPPQTIYTIQFDNNTLYLGTNIGLYIHSLDSNTTRTITTDDGLAHNVIENFLIDSKKRFWFDSPNSPIYSYSNNKFTYYNEMKNFNSSNLTDMNELYDGSILFSTAGNGVFLYKDSVFSQYTTKQGLLSNYVYFIESNSNGIVYYGHKNGVSIQDMKDTNKQIHSSELINQLKYIKHNSSLLLDETSLWIGTSNGIVNMPNCLPQEKKSTPILQLSNTLINHVIYPTDTLINMPHGNYFVDFNFKAISLNHSLPIHYLYKLEGFDKNWTIIPYEKEHAIYQSLKQGDYQFKIRLVLNHKIIGSEKTIHLIIELPFWKKAWFYFLMISLIILLFVVILYSVTRNNKRLKKVLVEKVKQRTKEIEIKNLKIQTINKNLEKVSQEYLQAKHIAEYQTNELKKSINYAKYIQKATFRRREYISWVQKFEDYFLIFKPKDIVSGDFYWGANKQEEYYIAVGDCTGHGVPGSLISMLGFSILNEACELNRETGAILDNVRKNLMKVLGQDGNKGSSYDGIDIVLLRYNSLSKKVQVSSAYNPLYIVRDKSIKTPEKGKQLVVLGEYKNLVLYSTEADRQPLGYHPIMTDFSSCTVQLIENDQIYLFSDGYSDQFGGPKTKKFMKRRFIQMLLEINHLELNKQKDFLWDNHKKWKGSNEQIDDISIVGIKI